MAGATICTASPWSEISTTGHSVSSGVHQTSPRFTPSPHPVGPPEHSGPYENRSDVPALGLEVDDGMVIFHAADPAVAEAVWGFRWVPAIRTRPRPSTTGRAGGPTSIICR
ncbi:hypothetical protein Apa02nite_081880 [Actinoplanes palleronii]|uniref:DUF3179 domain-containing protein n=1 Tax=Actinoplanes palleronii TaxID=113570 RepID=A0ABQ4BN13_9ACTN|nr:hypothetical protein Apa02nite_081880 [Actinoplanes palleronii]